MLCLFRGWAYNHSAYDMPKYLKMISENKHGEYRDYNNLPGVNKRQFHLHCSLSPPVGLIMPDRDWGREYSCLLRPWGAIDLKGFSIPSPKKRISMIFFTIYTSKDNFIEYFSPTFYVSLTISKLHFTNYMHILNNNKK